MADYNLIKASLNKSEKGELNSGLNSVLFQSICKTALKSLEKQMPKKIKGKSVKVKALDVETEQVLTYECLPCPTCEKWETANSKYCRSCGQKLDWD